MSENRDLPELSGVDRVSRLSEFGEWLDREGGTSRGIRIVRALVSHDLAGLSSGSEPGPCEPLQICGFLAHEGDRQARLAVAPEPDRSVDPGDLIRNAHPTEALERRLPKLESEWRKRGIRWAPRLARIIGGGRSNPSLYRIEFQPVEAHEVAATEQGRGQDGRLDYEVLPLSASWPLRWLFVQGGFEISLRSWRGVTYGGILIASMLMVILLGVFGLALLAIAPSRPSTLIQSAMSFLCALVLWRCIKPFLDVAGRRIVQSPEFLLPFREVWGQLKFVRRRDLKVPTGWLSLVRIRSQCPLCEAEVDLADGNLDFPGRTVGRCREAPTEHVFSFDQTTNRGAWLRNRDQL